MDDHIADLTGIAVIATVAVSLGFVLMRLKQPPVVGYILTGVVLGPTGAGLVTSSGAITLLAELGVIMLLFLIGMELSIRVFTGVAAVSAMVAAGQVVVALMVSAAFGFLLGWPLQQMVALGFIVAISSTAVAVQMLEDVGELRTAMGRTTIGVLIAQDIAVVPMMVVIDSFGGHGSPWWVAAKLVAAAVLIVAFVRFLGTRPGKLRLPFSNTIAGRVDLVALASLAFCFAAATVTSLAGLSAAFGAFLAGLVIAGSTLRAEAIAATHPIQSVLIVVFFLSIGLLIDLHFIVANLATVVLFVLAVLAIKSAVNVALLKTIGQTWKVAFPAGLMMAQIGEFSFVLAAASFANGAVDADAYRLAIAVIAISLLVSPVWMVSVRRFLRVAEDGIHDFRGALSEVYAGEIEEFERGRRAVGRVVVFTARQSRALWIVIQRRRARGRARRHGAAAGPRPPDEAGRAGDE